MRKSKPKFTLDTKIGEGVTRNTRAPKSPYFGVEVELENFLLGEVGKYQYWDWKSEASLRNNGIELVSRPIPFSDRMAALDEYQYVLKASTTPPQKTIRCSTHIHLNVSYLSFREVLRGLTAYYLLENLLVKTQSTHREGNLFCLRMSDAEYIGTMIREAIKTCNIPLTFDTNLAKYSAVNLGTIYSLGTIEFRFLSPMTDGTEILFWVEVLQRFLDFSQTVRSTQEVLTLYDALPLEDFFETVFTTNATEVFRRVREKYPNRHTLTADIHKNYDILQEISRLETRARFELPSDQWYPDVASPYSNELGTWTFVDEYAPTITAPEFVASIDSEQENFLEGEGL